MTRTKRKQIAKDAVKLARAVVSLHAASSKRLRIALRILQAAGEGR